MTSTVERGVTVVMVEQNLDFITELSHRVLLLQQGCDHR